ncbi:MAG: exo-beta-N-acetylmuramidase NamZ family protein, partial [Thermodesulfobacteriota bacterium]
FFAEKQDNMIESDDFYDPALSIPIFSLYGKTRRPTREMMDAIDVLVVDLNDVGTRVYTFLTTLSYCMEAAKETDKAVIVLDRPNPVGGGQVEGNCLAAGLASFVGRFPIPMRHGLTIGEYAQFINRHYAIDCSLAVICMQGWQRQMYFSETGLFWVPPSPNLPTPASAVVYPGQVIWEGTNVSEGRGTTQPFELFGAPFIDPKRVLDFMAGPAIEGAVLRPVIFEPTASKWAGTPCRGFQIHVTDVYRYAPYATSLKLLAAILHHHGDCFEWQPPPYEYEWDTLPIDLIIGDSDVRRALEAGADPEALGRTWQPQLNEFVQRSRPYHLYS